MTTTSAQSLLFITLGALFVPMISRRLRMPSAVGELIYGMVLGPNLLRMIYKDPFIDLMAQLGFAILMFSAGMEIDFAPLKKRGGPLLTAAIWVAAAVALSALGGRFLGLGAWPVLAVCSVSIGLASVFLRERKLLAAPIGQAVLAAGLIGETLSIAILTVLDLHHRLGTSPEFLLSAVKFTGIFFLAYALMRLFRFIIWWYPKKVGAFMDSGDPLELGVRLAVAMLFIFLAAAVVLGVEGILGAFIAGALFSFIFREKEHVADKINAMGQGFFVPFFFIAVGSHFDPVYSIRELSGQTFLMLVGLALAVKIIPSLLFRRSGLTFRELIAAGLLFAAPLTLTVAVAEVGKRVGAISSSLQGSLILAAIATGLISPYLARLILPRSAPPGSKVEEKRGTTKTPSS
ncbi:MAG TPA: cation:proton antiporter [bacterium]|nr:cation:proton antiporter [bacterium]